MENSTYILEDRQRIAGFYDNALSEFIGLNPVRFSADFTYSHYKYICYLDPAYNRSDVKRIMKDKYGVSMPGEVYADLCHTEPIWDNYTYCGKLRINVDQVQCIRWPGCGCDVTQGDFPGAEHISKYHICLPMYPGLDETDLYHVVESLEQTLTKDLS